MQHSESSIFFSIMICCYNSETYLRETIESIIKQSHTNWEIIAINDGSIDNTEKLIKSYLSSGTPITYYYQENQGFAAARNKAIELSRAEWIAIIDHDDICMPDRLSNQANEIGNNPNAKLFFGNSEHVAANGDFLRYQYDAYDPTNLDLHPRKAAVNLLTKGCFIDSETVVFNKQAAVNIGGFRTQYKYIVDYDFFIRMGQHYALYASSKVLSKWRIHEKQATKVMGKLVFDEHKRLYLDFLNIVGFHRATTLLLVFKYFLYLAKGIAYKLVYILNIKNNKPSAM